MNARTHLLIAMLCGWLYFRYIYEFGFEGKLLFALMLVSGSLLPDIDNPRSELGRKHKIISQATVHRGIFHTVWIPLIFIFIANFIEFELIRAPLFGLAIGYGSHLIADSFTMFGIDPFNPFKKIKIKGPLKTGGWVETIISAIIVLFFLVF